MRRSDRTTGLIVIAVALSLDHGAEAAARSRPVERAEAIDILRTASDRGHGDAQRTLASLGEETTPGSDAIRLYLAAQRNGDRHAADRLDLLRSEGMPMPFGGPASSFPMDGDIVPIGRIGDERSPGYHCHYFRPGRMWCHGGID